MYCCFVYTSFAYSSDISAAATADFDILSAIFEQSGKEHYKFNSSSQALAMPPLAPHSLSS